MPDSPPDTETNPVYLPRHTSVDPHCDGKVDTDQTTSGSTSTTEQVEDETPVSLQVNDSSTSALFMGPGRAKMPHRKTNYSNIRSTDNALTKVVD